MTGGANLSLHHHQVSLPELHYPCGLAAIPIQRFLWIAYPFLLLGKLKTPNVDQYLFSIPSPPIYTIA
jgi:hypothetical protein